MTNPKTAFTDLRSACAHFGSEFSEEIASSFQVPIAQSSLFRLGTPEEADELFSGSRKGYAYTRFGNPTVDCLANALAELEGGKDAVVTASGNAAVLNALAMALNAKEGPIVTHPDIYGGSCELLGIFQKTFRVPVVWCDPRDADRWAETVSRASVVLIETPSNPLWRLTDIAATADLAHATGGKLVVDNTVATPFNQRPLALGADFVIHSTSKFLNGHSDMIGGCVVSREPLSKHQRNIHKNLGATVNAGDAWLILRGLRTFALRMEAHNRNGEALANWLNQRPEVVKVYYPTLGDERSAAIFRKQMYSGGSMVSFDLHGGEKAARGFLRKLKLIVHGVSLGGMESLATQPAATSHRGMSSEERRRGEISDGLVRLSIGIESQADLLTDLEQALHD